MSKDELKKSGKPTTYRVILDDGDSFEATADSLEFFEEGRDLFFFRGQNKRIVAYFKNPKVIIEKERNNDSTRQ